MTNSMHGLRCLSPMNWNGKFLRWRWLNYLNLTDFDGLWWQIPFMIPWIRGWPHKELAGSLPQELLRSQKWQVMCRSTVIGYAVEVRTPPESRIWTLVHLAPVLQWYSQLHSLLVEYVCCTFVTLSLRTFNVRCIEKLGLISVRSSWRGSSVVRMCSVNHLGFLRIEQVNENLKNLFSALPHAHAILLICRQFRALENLNLSGLKIWEL